MRNDKETLKYSVFFEPAREGGFIAHVPALPGLVTQGETIEEAFEMAKDAIEGYLSVLAEDGEELPIESDETVIARVKARIPSTS